MVSIDIVLAAVYILVLKLQLQMFWRAIYVVFTARSYGPCMVAVLQCTLYM